MDIYYSFTYVFYKRLEKEITNHYKTDFYLFFIWQAIVRGRSVSTEGPFLFLAIFAQIQSQSALFKISFLFTNCFQQQVNNKLQSSKK
jgi:hypothetical protein